MKTIIQFFILTSLLFTSANLSASERPLRKLSLETLQGTVIEFFSKMEEPIEETTIVNLETLVRECLLERAAVPVLPVTFFIKPEKELNEPLDSSWLTSVSQSEENPQAK